MLPPPTTIATSTPRSWTLRTCLAIVWMRTGSAPYSSVPIRASPESLRRMRLKAGLASTASLLPDLEAGEAADDDVLAGRRRDGGAQLLDRLAVVLVGVDVHL